MLTPFYQEIPYADPVNVFALFHHEVGSVFLDSALQHESLGRYSFIGVYPVEVIQSKNGEDPFALLSVKLKEFPLSPIPELPPFQGGFAGYFGYELHQHLEQIPLSADDDMQFPDVMLGVYDLVIAFDHIQQKGFIFSSGFPEVDNEKRKQRAQERLEYLMREMHSKQYLPEEFIFLDKLNFHSYFTHESYCAAADKVINYILAGDIFEANISQRFKTQIPQTYSTFELYQRLRRISPASFAAYLNFSPVKIISASPERFLQLHNGYVETRPIKGTRRRGHNTTEDERIANELINSEKDLAENVMIVDLMRNDLSRVCAAASVKVPQLCGLESFATVHHLVSVVQGKLNPSLTCIDLLRAAFPGGSITGAPKIRAMEIIAEIEPTPRGPYCGSVGYINWDGNMDTSIIIRTITVHGDQLSFQVGGAIVADSNPQTEYEETLVKGHALFQALTE